MLKNLNSILVQRYNCRLVITGDSDNGSFSCLRQCGLCPVKQQLRHSFVACPQDTFVLHTMRPIYTLHSSDLSN